MPTINPDQITAIALALDHDGAVNVDAPKERPLETLISDRVVALCKELLTQYPSATLHLYSASYRALKVLNAYAQIRNRNGCCATYLQKLYDAVVTLDDAYKERVILEKVLLEDTLSDKEKPERIKREGETFDEMLAMSEDDRKILYNRVLARELQAITPTWHDELKRAQHYFIAHHFATKKPQKGLLIILDDLPEILTSTHTLFSAHDYLPHNIFCELRHYVTNDPSRTKHKFPLIQGRGETYDRHYQYTITQLAPATLQRPSPISVEMARYQVTTFEEALAVTQDALSVLLEYLEYPPEFQEAITSSDDDIDLEEFTTLSAPKNKYSPAFEKILTIILRLERNKLECLTALLSLAFYFKQSATAETIAIELNKFLPFICSTHTANQLLLDFKGWLKTIENATTNPILFKIIIESQPLLSQSQKNNIIVLTQHFAPINMQLLEMLHDITTAFASSPLSISLINFINYLQSKSSDAGLITDNDKFLLLILLQKAEVAENNFLYAVIIQILLKRNNDMDSLIRKTGEMELTSLVKHIHAIGTLYQTHIVNSDALISHAEIASLLRYITKKGYVESTVRRVLAPPQRTLSPVSLFLGGATQVMFPPVQVHRDPSGNEAEGIAKFRVV